MPKQQPAQQNTETVPSSVQVHITAWPLVDVTLFNLNVIFLDEAKHTFLCLCSYHAFILQAHHEGAHISCGLVVDDDHGFFFRDGPYVVTPLRYCKEK